ncbi:MAG: Two-component system sensor histidine kinase/response regulator hybrid [uncultured Solirubrobacteraceae bacterium]|uniref:histidine kinase n=1 Tax=uncultured Solirubrobacteraceae bacterium TaxID=1162706 RepID=A0A6J4RWU1_9ACTN|nr:MAG: Two-component system sensor histidine kinase/response regulator hybrid [uncultured Solirubrobacteraceae bacterium]
MSEERQLALLVGQAVDYAIFLMDREGFVETWNSGAQRMKGYTRDEIVGRHFSTFYTEADQARDHPAAELRIAAAEGRYEEEGWRVRKDGSRFWANIVITALHDEDGGLIGFGKVSRDLTVRRAAEEQTRARALALEAANRQLEEFRRLVSSVRDYAIFMLDPTGHVGSWNAGARHLKGYEPEEILGRHFSVFYTDEDRARRHPDGVLANAVREGRYEEEGWRVRKDGSRFWAGVTVTAVHDEDGRLTGFAKVTRDLTERKRDEEALRAAVEELRAANEELDRFASVAAHDMADPLRTISGFAEILRDAAAGEEQARTYAQHILDSSLRLTAMLQALLSFARAGAKSPGSVSVDLATAVEQVRTDLAVSIASRNVRVVVEVPEAARVLAGADDVRVILQNLVSNAIKFSDQDAPVVRIDAERREEDWRIAVHDNGPGIAPGDQGRIFGAFERARSGAAGHGLGLAICERLVERHGGRIGVDSAPGRGTTFWFILRAASAPDR